MAEDLLETVERLQSRILDNPEPRKLLKALKRLGELPMTVHILVETGVGKTVNSFRKHQVAGELAKSLVAKWKKLVPQSADRPNSHAKEAPCSQAQGHRHQREPSPEEQSYMEEEEEEEQGYCQGDYSPSPPHRNQYSPPQPNAYQSDEYESPEQEPEPSPPPPPPRKEVRHAKPSKDKNHHHSDRHKDRDEERRQRPAETSADRGRGDDGKKRCGERERQSSPVEKVAKHSRKSTTHSSKREEKKRKGGDDGEGSGRPKASKESPSKVEEEEEFEKHTMSFESFLTYDTPIKKKKKKQQLPSSSSSSHKQSSHSSSSRHSRTPPPPAPSSSSKESKANGAQGTKRSRSSSSSSAAVQTPEKRRRVVEALPTLPEIPLPVIQPNYRPLPSIDTPLSPQRRKVPVCNDEEDAGFTGKRFNSKMVVYSGSKTAYLPKMMTLYEQCIRVLQNNIDSIAEVGGVPYEILEPVLERCTPEQLYRIELSNQCFTEESDELWKRHCQRDFKRQSPQEFESWREMYLRLHDEREERLRMLTQNITSAHANKPKGRQVKMAFVNSVAKPPRDVRRRQEKFGTTSGSSTAASITAASPIKIRPVVTDDSRESSGSSSSLLASPAPSSRPSAPSGGSSGGGGLGREKPAVKKIAPMMAKTIKAFKNRFSRR